MATQSQEDELEYLAVYCPDCGSCGEWGCCQFDCAKCRNPETWTDGYGRMWDTRLPENKPKEKEGYKWYEHWEDME